MPAHECNRYHALPLALPLGLCFCRWMWCCFALYKVGTIIMTVAINAVPAEPCTLRPGGFGFMLYKESEAPLRAVQSELHYHDRGH